VVSEVDLHRHAVAGLSDSVRAAVDRSKPDEARIRDGLTKIVVEDRERVAWG
jgi:hypothetical protein